MMKNELERIWKEVVVARTRYYYPGICLEGLRKTTKPVRKAGVPGEIRTRQERYHYTSFLGNTTLAFSIIGL
jgi:hypothetical protein